MRPALRPLLGLAVALAAAPPAPAQAPPDPASIVAPTPRPGGAEAPAAETAAPRADADETDAATQPLAPPAAEPETPGDASAESGPDAVPAPSGDAAGRSPAAPRHDDRPVAYEVVNARAVPAPLGGQTGDPAAGPAAARAAGCGDCHVMPHGAAAAENGLVMAAARLQAGGLRLAIVNLGIRDPARADHAFYDLPPFDPEAEAPPTTLLTAAEVEAIVAWLTAAAR